MNKDALQELAMGAVLVVLAYAAYKHFMPATTVKAVARPAQGVTVGGGGVPSWMTPQPAQAPYSGSPLTALTDLFTGITTDVGAYEGRNYLNEMASPLLNNSTAGKDSIWVDGSYDWAKF